PVNLASAPLNGTVEGVVTVAGRPVSGVVLALVDLKSGAVLHAKSGEDGIFHVQVAPGDYVVASRGQGGLAVSHAPTRLSVAAGGVPSAQIAPVAWPVVSANVPKASEPVRVASLQEPAAPPASLPPPAPPTEAAGQEPAPGGVAIKHDPVGCFLA